MYVRGRRPEAGLTALVLSVSLVAGHALAQGGGGGGGGGSSSSGGAAGGSAGASSPGAASPGSTLAPGGPDGGVGARNAAPPGSTVPRRDTGISDVPSAGNAEPTSPINRQAAPLDETDTNRGIGTVNPSARNLEQDMNRGNPGDALTGSGQPRGAGGAGGKGSQADPSGGVTTSSRTGDNKGRVDQNSMEACMKEWDPATHLTKEEWRITCKRTLPTTPMDVLGPP